jgi:hypothetical protein
MSGPPYGDRAGAYDAPVTEAESTPYAFLSYCHVDKNIAAAVQDAMERRGWKVFRDETDIEAGESLSRTVAAAIERADLFIAVISADYVASKPCNFELDQAMGRKFGDDSLRVVALRVGEPEMPAVLRYSLYVPISSGAEDSAVERMLRARRDVQLVEHAGRLPRTSTADTIGGAIAAEPSQRDLVREAVRYARELEALAGIDAKLVDAQAAIELNSTAEYEERYREASKAWQDAWIRLTLPVSNAELLDRVQAIGSILSEVLLGDRTPAQVRTWVILRAIANARASIGYALRGQQLPNASFPGTTELRDLLGKGDGLDDPLSPLRARLLEMGDAVFHGN